jgi:hypothetical protein
MMLKPVWIAFIGLLVAVAGLAMTEALYRTRGYYPVQYPGWMLSEYLDRLDSIDPNKDIVFVGDSRVGWGVADIAISKDMVRTGSDAKAVNLGLPAASIEIVLRDLLSRYPSASGRILINFSPAAFYTFVAAERKYPSNLQQRIDQHIADWYSRNFASAHRSLRDLLHKSAPVEDWDRRIVYPEGFVNARLHSINGKEFDAASFQLDYYRKEYAGLAASLSTATQRLLMISDLVRRLEAAGWNVEMIRLPIGARMQQVERNIPEELSPERAASILHVRFIDLNPSNMGRFPTQDESHLTPQAAIAIAPLLADLATR